MSVTVTERVDSREYGTDGSVTFKYDIWGTSNDITAKNALLADASCPETYNSLLFREQYPRIYPIKVDTLNDSKGHWGAEVRYQVPNGGQISINGIPSKSFTFDMNGGTQHIRASRATTRAYGPNTSVSDNGNLINVTADGDVEGLDIDLTAFNFSITYYKTATQMTTGYLAGLRNLKNNPVNDNPFTATIDGASITFNAGEVRVTGISGKKNLGSGLWEITVNFSQIDNVQGLTIGSITGIEKYGQEYLWVKYSQKEGGPSHNTQKPIAVYCEGIYNASSYSVL